MDDTDGTADQSLGDDFLSWLAHRLSQPLPGPSAQAPMQPELSYGRYFGPPPTRALPAAVAVLLYANSGQWRIPLTLRPADMPRHAGQISLPGGAAAPGESSKEAALRELEEELGIAAQSVRTIGRLSSIYLYHTNYYMTPWVVTLDTPPQFDPCPREVAALLEFPLFALVRTGVERRKVQTGAGLAIWAPCYPLGTHEIWGATSLILAELICLVRERLAQSPR